MKGGKPMKINVTMNDELYKRMVDYADKNYLNKSQLISIALTDYLNAKQAITAMSEIALATRQIANSNEIDEDTKKELEKLELICSMMNVK